MSAADSPPPCRPVILGVDIGVYSLARAFHERYGVTSTVVGRSESGPINDSRILDVVSIGVQAQRKDMVAALMTIGAEHTGPEPLVLLYNSDSFAYLMTEHADELSQYYLFPRYSREVLERVSTKASFHEICAEVGVRNPRTVVQDFSAADDPSWQPAPVDIPFPWVAKPSAGAEYENLRFEGKMKTWYLPDQAAADRMYGLLKGAGFRGNFLVQELIPGDDTHMRWATSYKDRNGTVTMISTARVLLEDHSPAARGNPVVMLSGAEPELADAVEKILGQVDYHGFANFDIKQDARTGEFVFFEFNPRIGRANYCATAAGADTAAVYVDDIVHQVSRPQHRTTGKVLYTVVPIGLVSRYLVDPALKKAVAQLRRSKALVHPLLYPFERTNWRRRAYVLISGVNHRRKYRRYYPKRTENAF